MQISLRPHAIAGTTAVLGATAVVLAPVMAGHAGLPAPPVSDAAMSLSAFANPITAVLDTVGVGLGYVLNGVYSATPAQNWPYAGIGPFVNGAVLPALGYQAPGLIPQALLDPAPILTQYLSNAAGYLYNTAVAVGSAAADIGDILWSIPTTAIAVAVNLLTLNFAGAVAAVVDAVQGAITSISDAGTTLLDAGIFVAGNVIAKAGALVDGVTSLVPTAVNGLVNSVTLGIAATFGVVTDIVGAIATLNPENIWNATVEGLLSPAGLPGTLLNLTIGAGLGGTGDVPETFGPSLRTFAQATQTVVADALAAVPAPTAAVRAPSAAAARGVATTESGPSAGTRSGANAGAGNPVEATEVDGDPQAPAKARAVRGGRAG